MAALTAYFDDSGTHNDSATVVVAGFVSLPTQWKRFIREWNKAKLEYGFTEFHFACFLANNKDSDFADTRKWNDKYKATVLRKLRTLAAQHSIHAFSVSVSRRDYDELVVGDLRKDLGEHFTYAVRAVLGFIENWRIENGIDEPIEYIFSTMKGQPKREIDGVFDGAAKLEGAQLRRFGIRPGCHSFRDMREILPLQAADLLAGCVYQRDKVRVRGVVIPQYVADTFNYFLERKGFFSSKFQNREALRRLVSEDPHLIVPEDRRSKPTPKGTRPNPTSNR